MPDGVDLHMAWIPGCHVDDDSDKDNNDFDESDDDNEDYDDDHEVWDDDNYDNCNNTVSACVDIQTVSVLILVL